MKRSPLPRPAVPTTAADLLGVTFQALARETQAAAHQITACVGAHTVGAGKLWAPLPLSVLVVETGLSPSGVRKGLARALATTVIVRRGAPRCAGQSYEYALVVALALAETEEAAGHPVRAGPENEEKPETSGGMSPADSDVQPPTQQAERRDDPDRPRAFKSPVP